MKTKGQIEAAISEAVTKFEKEYTGRGPSDVRTYVVEDMIVIRLKGLLLPVEERLITEGDAVVASTIIGEWEVSLVTKGKERKLGATAGMPEAVGRAERWITANRADSLGLVLLRAKWRGRPASAKQVEYLKSWKISVPRGITKGQASHLVAMLPRRRARASG